MIRASLFAFVPAVTLAASLAFIPPALAQQQDGVTSGPAVGDNVKPGAGMHPPHGKVRHGKMHKELNRQSPQHGGAGVAGESGQNGSGSESAPTSGPGKQ